jgi:Uma2 family endonuclease
VLVAPLGDYDAEHPKRAHLIIEVAESSLGKDRGLKRKIYAHAAVPEYWIVNLVERCVEVYLEPENGRYRRSTCYARAESIRPACFPDLEVRVQDIMK